MRAWLSWSSGKDSAWALHLAREAGIDVVALLTTLTDAYGRVSMHGVREEILDAQAESAGLPLVKVRIPAPCPNEIYEREMRDVLGRARVAGVRHVVFGDLFLEDVRAYREARLAEMDMEPVFPLWAKNTAELARDMLIGGLSAHLVCVDPQKLDRSFAGRTFDERLLRDLPSSVDPCGERGEFHTCVVAGPMFRASLEVVSGPIVDRDGFVFADLTLRKQPR